MGGFRPLHKIFPTHDVRPLSDNSPMQPSTCDLQAMNLCSFFSHWTLSSDHSHSRDTHRVSLCGLPPLRRDTTKVQPLSGNTLYVKDKFWTEIYRFRFFVCLKHRFIFFQKKCHVLNLTVCREKNHPVETEVR